MATKEDVEAYSAKYGDPTSGGVLIREAESDRAKVIGSTPYSVDTNQSLANKQTLYQNTPNEWSLKPDVSISLDEKTGDIRIKAPKTILDQPSFKSVYQNNSVLKNLSATYKADKNAKMPDPTDESKSITIPELVSYYDQDLKKYANAVNEMENVRYNIRQTTNNSSLADALTESDFMYMRQSGTAEEDTDDSLISIPRSLQGNFFANLRTSPNFNADYSVISRGNLFNDAWNISKTSKDDIVATFTEAAAKMAEIERKEKITAEDAEEYARLIAFISFIQKNDPEAGFWEQLGMDVEAVGSGLISAAHNVGGNILILGEGALNLLNVVVTSVATGGIRAIKGEGLDLPRSTVIMEDVAASRQSDAEQAATLQLINNDAATINSLVTVGGTIAGTLLVGKYSANAITNTISAAAQLGTINATVQSVIEGGGTELAQSEANAIITATTGGIVSSSNLVNTAQNILALAKMDPARLSSSVQSLFQAVANSARSQEAVTLINGAVKTINTINKVATASDVVSQILLDTILTDPVALRELVENNDTEHAGELLSTLAFDALSYGAGFGLAAFANKFPSSTIGRTLNTRLARKEAQAAVATYKAKEGIKSLVLQDANYISKIKNANKRQVAAAGAITMGALEQVAKAGRTGDSWDRTLDIEKSLSNYAAVQNAIDDKVKGTRVIYNGMWRPDTSPKLSGALREMANSTNKIIALEKKYGLDKKENYSIVHNIPSVTTRLTNNYRGGLKRLEEIEGYQLQYGKKLDGMDKEIEAITAFNKEFESKYPELAVAAKDSLPLFAKGYEALNDFKDKHNILNKTRIEELNNNKIFQNGYVRTQRIKELDDTVAQRVQITVLERLRQTTEEQQHFSWGSTDDFVDPLTVFQDTAYDTAEIINSRDLMKGFTVYDGATRKIVVTGDELEQAVTVKKLRNNFHDHVAETFKGDVIKTAIAKSPMTIQLVDMVLTHQEFLNKEAATQKLGRKVSKAKVAEYKVTGVDRAKAFNKLQDSDIVKYSQSYNGYTFTNISEDYFNELINPETVKGDTLALALRKELQNTLINYSDYLGGMAGYGSVDGSIASLKDLPKISTDSYKKLMGISNNKDIDPAIKPYLASKGVSLESGDWGQYFPQFRSEGEGGASSIASPDDVLEAYTSLARDVAAQKEMTQLTYDNFLNVSNFDPELPNRLDRIALNKSGFLESDEMKKIGEAAKKESKVNALDMVWQKGIDELAELNALDKNAQVELVSSIDNLLTEFIYSGVLLDDASRKVIDQLSRTSVEKDAAKEYIVLWELYNSKKELGGQISKALEKQVTSEIKQYSLALGEDAKVNIGKTWNKFIEIFDDVLYDRRNTAAQVLLETGSPLVDQKGIYKETKDLMKKIYDAEDNPGIFSYTNYDGKEELVETDPLVAELVTTQPNRNVDGWFAQLMNSKAFEMTNRLFRLGATTFNAKSWLNQWIRDPLNGYIGGGAIAPLGVTENSIVKSFGSNIAEFYEANMPKLYEQFKEQARATGVSVGEVATRYKLAEFESAVEESTETQAYRINRPATTIEQFQNKATKVFNKIEYYTGEVREAGIRKAVAAQAFKDSLSKGHSVETATRFAKRAAQDATTDFIRQTYHLQAFTSTVPYLRAGINGTKSFWRLMSIDPVGVLTRLTTGIILPVIAATVAIMRDDEGREYYKTLYEREKDNFLIFSMNGKFYQIPIPQEVQSIVAPFRQMVEQLYDANRHSFWELAINDLVGIFPYDLTGFQDIDGIALSEDPTLLDRMGSMGMGLLSDILGPIGKTAFELTYGVDPYTGKKIDKSRTYLDENGDLQIMDSTTSEFAQWVGSFTGWSPSVVSTILTNFVGQTGSDILDSLVELGQWVSTGGQEGTALGLVEKSLSRIGGGLTVTEYDRTKNVWNSEVTKLFNEKEGLMATYSEYTEAIMKETNTEKRQALMAKRNDYIAPYLNKVKTTVERLRNDLGGSIDTYRFATVISLMNFDTTGGSGSNAYARQIAQDQIYENKSEAQMIIQKMGMSSPDTQSMLGYMYEDSNGQIQVKYYTPLEILNAQSIYYTSSDIFETELTSILKNAGITLSDKSAGYREQTTSAEKKQYKKEWNAKVANAIAPYIEKYGAANVFKYSSISETLDDYFYTDNYYNASDFMKSVFGE